MRDTRSYPPPPIRGALGKLSGFGVATLVNVAAGSVVWFVGHDDDPPSADIILAARVLGRLGAPPIASRRRYVVGQVRFPYVVVLRLHAASATMRSEVAELVLDVCGELRALAWMVPRPPAATGAPPAGAAPAHAVVYPPTAAPSARARGAA